ncbi:MAG: kelch repeat-containing protein, partial [Ginsengibacter sp.]
LDGSGSTDPDNNITGYAWAKISGPATFNIEHTNDVQTQVTNLIEGVYKFELTVVDKEGLSAKDSMQINVIAFISSCPNRPIINARLVSVGSLTLGAIGLVSATANNKILFAGGVRDAGNSARVDIYDITTNTWSNAELSQDREFIVAASVGSKIFFAGGEKDPWGYSPTSGTITSRVDIYDASNNSWSTAELSTARAGIAASSVGSKVLFVGGYSNVVDIYDNSTNTWSTSSLSEARSGISATTAGNKIYFAGGSGDNGKFSSKIDIYDASTNSWSTSNLLEAKSNIAGIAVANKIYWAGGVGSSSSFPPSGFSNKVEIRDLITGVSSLECVIPRLGNSAVVKGDNLVFFTGYEDNHPLEGIRFEIYNTVTNTWSTGVLNQKIFDATVISVNNVIYVAGGRGTVQGPQGYGGPFFKQVWKLEF